jgi:hypothetical protein
MSEKGKKALDQDQYISDKDRLTEEARRFRLPSEWMPQTFKVVFFIGLALLNVRLFTHVVPGWWGYATAAVAVMAEVIALYASHYFSRGSGWFRWALGLSGGCLLAFSIVHSTFSILDMNGAADLYPGVYERINFYSHVIAFPLLAGLLGLSVIGITMTHPINRIRLQQAAEHTEIAIARAKAASQLELMRAQATLHLAWLDHLREQNEREKVYLELLQELIAIEESKAQMIASVNDPALRRKLANELSFQAQKPFAAAPDR